MQLYYAIREGHDPNPMFVEVQHINRKIEPQQRFEVFDLYAERVLHHRKARGVVRLDDVAALVGTQQMSMEEYLLRKEIEAYKNLIRYYEDQWDYYLNSQDARIRNNQRPPQPPRWIRDHIGDVNGLYTTVEGIENPKPNGKVCLIDIVRDHLDSLQSKLVSSDFDKTLYEGVTTLEDDVMSKPIPVVTHDGVRNPESEAETSANGAVSNADAEKKQSSLTEEQVEQIETETVNDPLA